jgi:hypothetical protein
VLFVIVAPAVHLVALGTLWVMPLTRLGHARVLAAAEVARAWASLEVFVVGTLAAVLQVSGGGPTATEQQAGWARFVGGVCGGHAGRCAAGKRRRADSYGAAGGVGSAEGRRRLGGQEG